MLIELLSEEINKFIFVYQEENLLSNVSIICSLIFVVTSCMVILSLINNTRFLWLLRIVIFLIQGNLILRSINLITLKNLITDEDGEAKVNSHTFDYIMVRCQVTSTFEMIVLMLNTIMICG